MSLIRILLICALAPALFAQARTVVIEGRISGVVESAKDTPVARMALRLLPDPDWALTSDWRPRFAREVPFCPDVTVEGAGTTDGEGKFDIAFKAVLTGEHFPTLNGRDHYAALFVAGFKDGLSVRSVIKARTGSNVFEYTVWAAKARIWKSRLLDDQTGLPLAGQRIDLALPTGVSDGFAESALSGQDGRFEVTLPGVGRTGVVAAPWLRLYVPDESVGERAHDCLLMRGREVRLVCRPAPGTGPLVEPDIRFDLATFNYQPTLWMKRQADGSVLVRASLPDIPARLRLGALNRAPVVVELTPGKDDYGEHTLPVLKPTRIELDGSPELARRLRGVEFTPFRADPFRHANDPALSAAEFTDGAWSVRLPASGRYLARPLGDGLAEAPQPLITVDISSPAALVMLDPCAYVDLRILDPGRRESAPGSVVWIKEGTLAAEALRRNGHSWRAWQQPLPEGGFAFKGAPGQLPRLAPGNWFALFENTIVPVRGLKADENRTVVHERGTGRVELVVYEGQRPWASRAIRLDDKIVAMTLGMTDAQGRIAFENVPARSWYVTSGGGLLSLHRLDSAGYLGTRRVDVQAGATTQAVINMKAPGGSETEIVFDGSGCPVPGHVTAMRLPRTDDLNQVHVRVGDGRASLGWLDKGAWRIACQTPDATREMPAYTFDIEVGETGQVIVAKAAFRRISGKISPVKDRNGEPYSVTVWAQKAEYRQLRSTQPRADGSFDFIDSGQTALIVAIMPPGAGYRVNPELAVSVKEGLADVSIDLTLPEKPGSLRIEARVPNDSEGHPAWQGFQVWMHPKDGPAWFAGACYPPWFGNEDRTLARAQFHNCPPGKYRVELRAEGAETVWIEDVTISTDKVSDQVIRNVVPTRTVELWADGYDRMKRMAGGGRIELLDAKGVVVRTVETRTDDEAARRSVYKLENVEANVTVVRVTADGFKPWTCSLHPTAMRQKCWVYFVK